jgi:hypothetical protein
MQADDRPRTRQLSEPKQPPKEYEGAQTKTLTTYTVAIRWYIDLFVTLVGIHIKLPSKLLAKLHYKYSGIIVTKYCLAWLHVTTVNVGYSSITSIDFLCFNRRRGTEH